MVFDSKVLFNSFCLHGQWKSRMQGTLPSKIQCSQLSCYCRGELQKTIMPLKGKWLDVLQGLNPNFSTGWPFILYVYNCFTFTSFITQEQDTSIFWVFCVICVLMEPLPQCFPQPLWFPIGHRHPGVVRNRVTPMGAAARKEAVFAADIHSPFCSYSQQRYPKAGHTWKLQVPWMCWHHFGTT